MPDFLPTVEAGLKCVRGAFAFVGSAIDTTIPMQVAQRAHHAIEGFGPVATSAVNPRAEVGGPDAGGPAPASGVERVAAVVRDVLAVHRPDGGQYVDGISGPIHCTDFTRRHIICADWMDWREHVADEIAKRLETPLPVTAFDGRGAADFAAKTFPQYSKPRM